MTELLSAGVKRSDPKDDQSLPSSADSEDVYGYLYLTLDTSSAKKKKRSRFVILQRGVYADYGLNDVTYLYTDDRLMMLPCCQYTDSSGLVMFCVVCT